MSVEQRAEINESSGGNIQQDSTQPKLGEVEGSQTIQMNNNNQISYDINSIQNQNLEYTETEMHTLPESSKLTDEESLDKETYKLEQQVAKEDPILTSNQKLYGNNINDMEPASLGNLKAFWYVDHNPKILIGKNSKLLSFL